MFVKRIVFIISFLFLSSSLIAQDIEKISKEEIKNKIKEKFKKPLTFSGGITAQTVFYNASGMEANRDPFLWQLGVNMNLNLLGIIDAPFSAIISSQQFQKTLPGMPTLPQPPTTFGISPKYKAFTVHLGYRSIDLSEFSLSGSQFLGVGLEVAPKKSLVKGKVLWGRFSKPILFNPDGTIATTPSYARYGWGAGITVSKTPKNEITFNIFKAKDEANSLDTNIADLSVRPADNLVFGIVTKQAITKKISFNGEIDFSLFTSDLTVKEQVTVGNSYANNLFLFRSNSTSNVKSALLCNLNFKPKLGNFKLKYRRVAPDYQTLGTSYINSDYEDVSLKSSIGILKKKVTVGITGGMQRNNLNGDRAAKLLRLIGGTDITYLINDKWTLAANYSNFNSQTRQTIVITIDSLYFSQVTKTMGVNATRVVSNDSTFSQSLNMAFNYQDAIVNEVKETSFYNGNVGWQSQFLKTKTTVALALIGFHSITKDVTISNYGPSGTFGKSFFKEKLQVNLTAAYLPTYLDSKATGSVTNVTISGNYALSKKHKINYTVSNIRKNVPVKDNTSEITATLNYNYTF